MKILKLLPAFLFLVPVAVSATEQIVIQPKAESQLLGNEDPAKQYSRAWQRRLVAIQAEFVATLSPAQTILKRAQSLRQLNDINRRK